MKNTVYETMTRWIGRVSSNSVTVRVWRESTTKRRGPDLEVTEALDSVSYNYGTSVEELSKLLIDAVCKLDRIAAIEVVDREGNGEVFYPDWK